MSDKYKDPSSDYLNQGSGEDEQRDIDIKQMTYDDFFQFIWDDSNLSKIVSVAYQSEYEDYIRSYTFDMHRLYLHTKISEQVMLKFFEIHFFNLFRFKPKNENIKEIKDKYTEY